MDNGWEASAAAWIADMGEAGGDFSRRHVLDAPMLARVARLPVGRALDVGCGEGRFCRMLRQRGWDVTGIDPTHALLDEARRHDPAGHYEEGAAEALTFADGAFDLVVSYLSLIDIPDMRRAIAEMSRVLAPGGALLVAHLNGFATSGGWIKDAGGRRLHFAFDHYLEERSRWEAWRGIRILNHHRPLSAYIQTFLGQGLTLTHFDEPAPAPDAPAERADDYRRAPWHCVMEWRKAA
jgi:SAM-dependent methyltransferase